MTARRTHWRHYRFRDEQADLRRRALEDGRPLGYSPHAEDVPASRLWQALGDAARDEVEQYLEDERAKLRRLIPAAELDVDAAVLEPVRRELDKLAHDPKPTTKSEDP